MILAVVELILNKLELLLEHELMGQFLVDASAEHWSTTYSNCGHVGHRLPIWMVKQLGMWSPTTANVTIRMLLHILMWVMLRVGQTHLGCLMVRQW